jgi:hypothetical protein
MNHYDMLTVFIVSSNLVRESVVEKVLLMHHFIQIFEIS